MEDEYSYDLYVSKHRRDINCLLDQDRNIRKTAFDKLLSEIFGVNNKEYLINLTREYMLSPVLKCLEDKIEKIRESAVKMILKLMNTIELDDKMNNLILTSIISRLNHVPFPETCNNLLKFLCTAEELRQQLIKIIDNYLTKYPNEIIPVISEMSNMISKLLTDPCPEVKIKLSELLINLSAKLNKVIGPHMKGIIMSLCNNLKHQHNKIRKITVLALADCLLCENAGKHFEEAIPILKVIANDKNYDVRKALYSCVYKLITNFNIIYLRKFEHFLVILLMNGLSDEKSEIRMMSMQGLEDAGKYRKELAVELGEDITDFLKI